MIMQSDFSLSLKWRPLTQADGTFDDISETSHPDQASSLPVVFHLKDFSDESRTDASSPSLSKRCSPLKSKRREKSWEADKENLPQKQMLGSVAELNHHKQAASSEATNIELAKSGMDHNEKILSLNVSSKKKEALLIYYHDGANCKRIHRNLIFKEIVQIEAHGVNEDRSVEGLLLCLCQLQTVDLAHPLSKRLILDILRECNKETVVQLTQWLIRQRTFHPGLLKECLRVFNEVCGNNAFDPYAITLLLKFYRERNWQLQEADQNFILPSNDEQVTKAVTLLIKENPNENSMIELIEWLMKQPSFDLKSYVSWVRVFRQKEQEKGVSQIYYPLLKQMLVAFQQKWGFESLNQLDIDVETREYLRLKNPFNPLELKKEASSQAFPAALKKTSQSKRQNQNPQANLDFFGRDEGRKEVHVPPKMKALALYGKDPHKCGKIQKTMIFKDITHIQAKGVKGEFVSVEELIRYLSQLEKIDLSHPLSESVILDTFRECNKETEVELAKWLSQEETFHPELLMRCFAVFNEKFYNQIPFNPFAIELLVKAYQKKKWDQKLDDKGNLVFPSNHEQIAAAMAILIKLEPNQDRIIALARGFMMQPNFDLQTFSRWMKVFKQKEEANGKPIYFPLCDEMLNFFHQKWGIKFLSQLGSEMENYVRSKGQLKS